MRKANSVQKRAGPLWFSAGQTGCGAFARCRRAYQGEKRVEALIDLSLRWDPEAGNPTARAIPTQWRPSYSSITRWLRDPADRFRFFVRSSWSV